MIKKREKCKKELLQLTIEILDKRVDMEDYTGSNLAYAEAQKVPRSAFYPLYQEQCSKVCNSKCYGCCGQFCVHTYKRISLTRSLRSDNILSVCILSLSRLLLQLRLLFKFHKSQVSLEIQ